MNDFLELINEFNHSIVNGIDDTYTVASYIEDFASGSIKWWLVDKLNKVSDSAIDKFVDSPVKTTIASILKISKKKTIEYLSSNQYQNVTPHERKQHIIEPILKEIESKKEELNKDVLVPRVIDIDETRLLKSLSKMSEISKDLQENISFISDYEGSEQFVISPNIQYDDFVDYLHNEGEDVVSVSEHEQLFSIVSVVFKQGNKWRLFDGNKEINASIKDSHFLDDVENGNITFAEGDRLQCVVKLTQLETPRGLKNNYEITEVKKHIKRPDQLSLLNTKTIKQSPK